MREFLGKELKFNEPNWAELLQRVLALLIWTSAQLARAISSGGHFFPLKPIATTTTTTTMMMMMMTTTTKPTQTYAN